MWTCATELRADTELAAPADVQPNEVKDENFSQHWSAQSENRVTTRSAGPLE